jgi:hypothetical protein
VSFISLPLNVNSKGITKRGNTVIFFLKLASLIYSENFITILEELKLTDPLGGYTSITVGGVSSIGPPGGILVDAQFHSNAMPMNKKIVNNKFNRFKKLMCLSIE